MKANRKKMFLTAFVTTLAFFSLVTASMAWFSTILHFHTAMDGSSISNYYASGTGTELDPYIITTPKHVYNFSWLQNSGAYPTKTYFKLGNDINMAGSLTGFVGSTTGAVPPIGTDQHPFLGSLDGQGYTIKNLWVSSDPLDWKEKPANFSYVQVGNSIGFFGNIGATTATPRVIGSAKHFYLENLEVTNKVNNSFVGIVAGYANGSLVGIGVKNARITLGSSIRVTSDFSLIGKLGPNISWADSPDQSVAGNLLVDPNYPGSTFTALNYPSTRVVPNSLIGTAYYVGSLTVQESSVNASNSMFVKYNPLVEVIENTNQVISTTAANITQITASNYIGLVSEEFWARYQQVQTLGKALTVLLGTTYPPTRAANNTWNNSVTLPAEAGTSVTAPRNSIWFKPKKGGTSGLSFFRFNQGADNESISVYQFKRNGTQITNFNEIRFMIDKTAVGNRTGVYFDFKIPNAMVAAGYEFLVATSSLYAAKSAGFFYLSLSGTDETGGEDAGLIDAVDFTYRLANGQFEDLMADNYVPKRTILKFDGTYSGSAYYNMLDYPGNDGKVYYFTDPSTFIISNTLTGTVGVRTTNTTNFPPRQTS